MGRCPGHVTWALPFPQQGPGLVAAPPRETKSKLLLCSCRRVSLQGTQPVQKHGGVTWRGRLRLLSEDGEQVFPRHPGLTVPPALTMKLQEHSQR